MKWSKHWLDKYASHSGVPPYNPKPPAYCRSCAKRNRLRLEGCSSKMGNSAVFIIYWGKYGLPEGDEEVVQRIMDAFRENAFVMPSDGILQENLEV